ncbi:hypothetical protein [Phocaeicola dorei]|uniref:hypothetical protein n=1 Tax=Phocaeicola dorei TaxID=357276 RepID=UPI003BEF19C0
MTSFMVLPELNRRAICHSKHVANPGCFATCIQLGFIAVSQTSVTERGCNGKCHYRKYRGRG